MSHGRLDSWKVWKKVKIARAWFRKFAMEGIGRDELMKGVKSGLYPGSGGFIEKVKKLLESNRGLIPLIHLT